MTETAVVTAPTLPELPSVWPGYLLSGGFFVVEIGEAIADPSTDQTTTTPMLWLIIIAANLYWLFCLFRIHRVLAVATNAMYPIGPVKAVGFHFIPLFNLYWLVHWPNKVAEYVDGKLGAGHMVKVWPGLILILGFILTQIDGAIGLAVVFSALLYIRRKLAATLPE
jgi:hypothetical protein